VIRWGAGSVGHKKGFIMTDTVCGRSPDAARRPDSE
jgi:hypothetical protein